VLGYVDPAKSIEAQFSTGESGANDICNGLANTLATVIADAFAAEAKGLNSQYGAPGNNKDMGKLKVTPEEKAQAYDELIQSWVTLIRGLAQDQVASPMGSDGSGMAVMVSDYSTASMYSPVFPVSDERGYEVIGSYRYGRGLSIEPGGNFQQLTEEDPFTRVSVDAIQVFIEEVMHKGSPGKALGELAVWNPEAAAELATAWAEATRQDLSGQEALKILSADPNKFDEGFRAWRDSNKQFTQKVSPVNAAYGLADLGLLSTREVCSCKGSDADVLLLAFGEQNFVSIDQPDEVSAWLADRMLEAGSSWQASQQALRGQVLDTGGVAGSIRTYGETVGEAAEQTVAQIQGLIEGEEG
jgi:hypothetical protein